MATAKRTVKITTITLTLSEAEAQFLADIMGAIGGDPISSRRKHQEPIAVALRSAGIPSRCARDADYSGSIYFQ